MHERSSKTLGVSNKTKVSSKRYELCGQLGLYYRLFLYGVLIFVIPKGPRLGTPRGPGWGTPHLDLVGYPPGMETPPLDLAAVPPPLAAPGGVPPRCRQTDTCENITLPSYYIHGW